MYEKAPYTPGMREVLKLSKAEAGRLGHDYIGPEHYLLGIIRKGDGLAVQTLHNLEIDLEDLKTELERSLEIGNRPNVSLFSPNSDARRVLEATKEIARQMRHSWVGTEHLLLALIKEENTTAAKCLAGMGVDYDKAQREVVNVIDGGGGSTSAGSSSGGGQTKSKEPQQQEGKTKTPALDTFGRDLTQLAREGKLDPVIGREDEIERILQILCRRTKNNPILLGEPGVGKTAIVEGLAQKIVNDDIPELLAHKRLLSLDLAAVVAGTKYRGQFEERLKAIMQEIRRSKDVLIFIDELHTLVGAGAAEGAIDASNMLKPALSRGEIQCIGATTLEEYRKYIEKDGALERRFQSITIDPPSLPQTIEIIKGLRSRYEQHHGVIIPDDSIETAAFLSDRYITDRFLPDKAIDVVDEAGSRARLQMSVKPEALKELDKQITDHDEKIRELAHKQEFEECQKLKMARDEAIREKERVTREWQASRKDREMVKTITPEDVAYIVSKWTGIPVYKLEEAETKKLLKLEEELAKRVVSQKEAISAIGRAIRRSRSGLKDPARPTASFIFLGPTGVGKTELAKALAEFMFGSEESLIRVDMSEYMEKFSVSRLVGAPPGYVGYEEGGQLTEKVRQKPYSVVLLDEIEKAHPDVFSLLLQVFDDGRLTDSWGHVVDFRNTVIIMTSNAGTKKIMKAGTLGFTPRDELEDYDSMKSKVMGAVKNLFNPEFINRLDEVIVFKSLDREDIARIVEIMMGRVNKRLADKHMTIELTAAAKDYLVENGYDVQYGARPMRRAIQKSIEDPLSQHILEGSIVDGEVIGDLNDEHSGLVFHSKQPDPEPAIIGD